MTRFLGVAVDPIEGATLLNPQMTGGRIARTSGVSLVLAQSAVPASVTGTTSETVLATIPVPAGAMGPNGALRVSTKYSQIGGNTRTFRVRLGDTELFGGPQNSTSPTMTLGPIQINNRGVSASQVGSMTGTNATGLGTGNSFNVSAIDMLQAQNLIITGQLANAADTITLEAYTVELLNP